MTINNKKYIERHFHIKSKSGADKPLKFNAAQCKLYNAMASQSKEGKPIRVIVLKARQMGFSTLTEALIFKKIATSYNFTAAVVAHTDESSTNLFNMAKYYYDNLSPILKPQLQASNAKEIHFGKFNSRLRCYTAGGDGIGRSSTIQLLHISELAFWKGKKDTILLGLLQAVPNTPSSMIVIESTANGYEMYKELWDRAVAGESSYIPIFVGWNELDEYQMQYNGEVLTAAEEELKSCYHLSNEQIMWRRWSIANNCGGDINLFRQEYPICPDEAFIVSGACVFDKEVILARLASISEPVMRGQFSIKHSGTVIEHSSWQNDNAGCINIYKSPVIGRPYVIAADTAGEGSDYQAAHVIDNITLEQVAVIHGHMDEDIFAEQLYCIGKYYNTAMIGVETNFSTYPIKRLEQLGYPHQYVREVEDSITHRVRKSYGFRTDKLTRPLIISELIRLMREHIEIINDRATLQEMLTFVKNNRGRAEAQQGSNDDLVMALAMVYYVRSQQRTSIEIPIQHKSEWIAENDAGSSYIDEYF